MHAQRKAPAVLAALALGIAGCGGDEDDEQAATGTTPTGSATTETSTAAKPDRGESKKKRDDDKRAKNDPVVEGDQGTESVGMLKVSETEYAIGRSEQALLAEGVWTFRIKNRGKETHALNIEGPNGETESGEIAPGETKTVQAYLVSGKYELYCPIGDHAERGMRVTLPVKG